MPVFDYRSQLTPPQTAPQNPGFQRTRQLAGMPTDPFQSALAFERAAPGIRANQGLAYLQGIQNHQNEIAQQAQNIRIEQEAQLAAEQATQGLSGIQPDNPQYLNQRQQILQQNPNALLNPQFRNALGIYDEGYQRVAQQRALEAKQIQAQRQQAHALGLRAIEYGAPPDVVAEHVQTGNIGVLAQITGEARRAGLAKPKGSTEKDYRDGPMQQFIKSSLESLPQVGDVNPDTQKPFTRADISGLAASVANDAHRQFYPEKYAQAEAETSTSKAPPAPATQTGSQLREVLGGGPPKAAFSLPSAEEFRGLIESNQSSPDMLGGIIQNTNVPLDLKQEAFAKMKSLIAASKPPANSTFTEAARFKETNNKKLEDAQFAIDTHHLQGQWANAWSKQKTIVSDAVAQMSKDLGVDENIILSSLAKKPSESGRVEPDIIPTSLIPEELRSSSPRAGMEKGRFVKDLFASYLAKAMGRNPGDADYQSEVQNRINQELSHWGRNQDLSSDEKKALTKIGADGKFTQEDVLNNLLKERAVNSEPQMQPSVKAPVANIKSVKQIQ